MNQDKRIFSRRPRWLRASKSATGGSNKPQRAAFTLVEIMIVVCMVALLAVIAIPNFLKTRATAWQGTCVSNLRHIDDAIQQWAMETGKGESASVGFTDISPYLRRTVICPAGGQSFDDSYLLNTVADAAACLRAPATHVLPWTPLEVVSATSTSPGSSGPPAPPPSGGNGLGGGPAARPAPPGHGGGNGHSPPGHTGPHGGNGSRGP